jgi:hypothetical protein
MKPTCYLIKPAIASPVIVCFGLIIAAFVMSPWALTAMPFAILASFCAQPNCNMADGCLAYASMAVGLFLWIVIQHPAGGPIILGTLASYSLAVVEKTYRAKPLDASEGEPNQSDHENSGTT